MAITIQVDLVHGVAGLVQPGDFVNVLVTKTTDAEQPAQTAAPHAPEGGKILFSDSDRYLFQKVQVLAIDKTALPQTGDAAAATGTDGSPRRRHRRTPPTTAW